MINVAGILVGNGMWRTVNEVVPVEMHSKIQKKTGQPYTYIAQ